MDEDRKIDINDEESEEEDMCELVYLLMEYDVPNLGTIISFEEITVEKYEELKTENRGILCEEIWKDTSYCIPFNEFRIEELTGDRLNSTYVLRNYLPSHNLLD